MQRLREEFCQRDKACVAGRLHLAVLLQRPISELVAATAPWRGFGVRLQHSEGSGPICSNSMKFRVVHVGELRLPDGQTFILAALDVGYCEFEPYDSKLPSAARTPDSRGTGARVRLTRPEGSSPEAVATIGLVSGIAAPAILSSTAYPWRRFRKEREFSFWQMQREGLTNCARQGRMAAPVPHSWATPSDPRA